MWKRDSKAQAASFPSCWQSPARKTSRGRRSHFSTALSLFGLGYSWGGFPSLALHVNLDERQILQAPKEGPVLRLHIGLEDVADLKAGLRRHESDLIPRYGQIPRRAGGRTGPAAPIRCCL
ncbi:hypothetical protein [Rhizobium herbae]